MQLSYDIPVFTAEGKKVGTVKELIIDPRHRTVTHIVIKEGLFFSHDRLISTENIETAENDEIKLKKSADQVEKEASQPFTPEEYIELDDEEIRNRYGTGGSVWRRPAGELRGVGLDSIVPPGIGPIPPEPEVSIPEGEVDIRAGATVTDSQGTSLGEVKEFITDENDHITHLVLTEGPVFKETKTVPVDWIRKISPEEIQLGVLWGIVDRL